MKSLKRIVSVLIFSIVCFASSASAQTAAAKDGWKWRFKTAETVSETASDEKTVFVAEYEGGVYALDKQSGRKVWELKGGGYGIWLEKNVLIASGAGKIQAFAADTRQLLWSENLAANDSNVSAVSDESVFVAEDFAGLTALDLRTGKRRWLNRDAEKVSSVRAADGGDLLFIAGSGGNLFALDRATGETVWKHKRHGYFDLLASGEKSLIVSYTNGTEKSFASFEKTTGKQLWTAKLDSYDSFTTVSETNRLYVTFLNSPSMLALDTETGAQIWTTQVPDPERERDGYSNNALNAPTIAGDFLYCGGRNGTLYAFAKATGKLLWTKKLAAEDLASPIVVGDTAYAAALNKLFAFDLKTRRALWRFPAYGSIFPLKYEADGTLYFPSQENSYNALDLKTVERLARLKKPLGTPAPVKNALDSLIPVVSLSSYNGKRERAGAIVSEPDFSGGKAYFTFTNQAAEQGALYELDLQTGETRAIAAMRADRLSTPKIARGRAYFTNASFDEKSARKPFLYAVEIDSGEIALAREIEYAPQFAPEAVADLIVVSGKDKYVYAYDATGEYKWRIFADLEEYYKREFIAADGKSFYLRRTDKILSAVGLAAGDVAWLFEKPDPEHAIQTLSAPTETAVLAGVYRDALYALDKSDGRVLWKTPFAEDSINHITLAPDAKIAFVASAADNSEWLQAVSVADGKVLWEKSVGSDNPAFLFGADVCAASSNGFYCFKQSDGSRSTVYRTDKKFYGFSPDGILLYATEKERDSITELEGVNLRNGKTMWNISLRGLGKFPSVAPKK